MDKTSAQGGGSKENRNEKSHHSLGTLKIVVTRNGEKGLGEFDNDRTLNAKRVRG